MGHIRRLGKQKYVITVECGVDPATGKRSRKTKTIKGTKEQAKIVMGKMLEKEKSELMADTNITLKNYLREWIDNHQNNISDVTTKDYRSIIENHLIPSLGELKLKDIKPTHIIKYQNEKLENGRLNGSGGLSKRSVQAHHRLLSLALKHAVNPFNYITSNPCKPVQAPSPSKNKVKPFTRKEANHILNSLDDILLYTIFHLALHTGMRRSEITGLKWKDLNLPQKLLEVRRSGRIFEGEFIYKKLKNDSSRRQIALTSSSLEVLKKFKKKKGAFSHKEQALFLTPEGHPVRPDYLTMKFKKICKSLNINGKRFHDLRHTHATWLLEEGVNPKVVQKRLGHARVETTLNIYSHVSLNEQRKAAEKFEAKT